ncbi:MAG TPA: TetR/AcrR family transcriptional regulator [Blastocatellia bacterium]|nr:TetR/AcrR family transcriptional regulator [Blastocatellia bacterium]
MTARAPKKSSRVVPGEKRRNRKPSGNPRRQQIFEKALELMQENGFHATSIQDLADELGFTKAAFYFYVQSKEEMLYEISMQNLNFTLEQIMAISQSNESPPQKIRNVIDCYVRMMVDQPAFFIVYFRDRGFLSPKHRSETNRMERKILRVLEGIYEDGIRCGQFRNSDRQISVLGILGMCFWVYNWRRKRSRLSADETSRVFQTLALSGISEPSLAPPTRRKQKKATLSTPG